MIKLFKFLLFSSFVIPTIVFLSVACSASEKTDTKPDTKDTKLKTKDLPKKPHVKISTQIPKVDKIPKAHKKGGTNTIPQNNIIDTTNLWLPTPTSFLNNINNDNLMIIGDTRYLYNASPSEDWFDEQTKNLRANKHYSITMPEKKYLWNGNSYKITYTAEDPYVFPGNLKTITKDWIPVKLAEPIFKDSIEGEFYKFKFVKMVDHKNKKYAEYKFRDKSISHLLFFDYDKKNDQIISLPSTLENHLLFEVAKHNGSYKIKPGDYKIFVIPAEGNYYYLSRENSITANWIHGGYDIKLKLK